MSCIWKSGGVSRSGEMGAAEDHVQEVYDTFRRDGRLVGLGDELGVIDLLPVDKRQDAGADTNEFGVCVAQIHRDVDAVLLPKKGLRRADKEGVLEVRVDVGCLVKDDVCEYVGV